MTVPAVVAVVGGVLAALWSGLILRLWVGWIHVPGHPNRAVFGRPVGVVLALVAPPLLLSLPWLAEGPAWARATCIGIWRLSAYRKPADVGSIGATTSLPLTGSGDPWVFTPD